MDLNRLPKDSFAYLLTSRIDRLANEQIRLSKNLEFLGEVIRDREPSVELQSEIKRIKESVKELNFIIQKLQRVEMEIPESFLREYLNRFTEFFYRKTILVLLGGYLVAGGLGWFVGSERARNQLLQQTAIGQKLLESQEVKEAWKFVQKNPHLLSCAGRGLEKYRIGNKIFCQPVGGSRGWLLP
jgi:hypothetical protein